MDISELIAMTFHILVSSALSVFHSWKCRFTKPPFAATIFPRPGESPDFRSSAAAYKIDRSLDYVSTSLLSLFENLGSAEWPNQPQEFSRRFGAARRPSLIILAESRLSGSRSAE